MAQARELTGDNYYVVSVIGDGALTGGMAYEAMNNASRMKTNFIIVLNDNQMSISENVGGMNQYLNSFRTSDAYLDLKDGVTNSLNRIPVVGGTDGQTDPERQKRYQTAVCSGNVF